MSEILHGCLPNTEYFEVDTKAGHRYGIWVTTPTGYADSTDPLPLIYVLDGNWTVGLTAPLIVVQSDPYLTIEPYIQVSIGYAGEEAARWAQLRNRDLVPPGEPISDDMVATLTAARDSGAMTQAQVDTFLAEVTDTHGDVFLDFLTTELHPQVQSRFRVSETGHGLFGYSYGGLFSLYAYLRGAGPFTTFGAGSPGVAGPRSQIFDLVAIKPEEVADSEAAHLHITVNEVELLGAVQLYRAIARNALEVVEQLRVARGVSTVSTALLHGTHLTGLQESFLSYLKNCHSRR